MPFSLQPRGYKVAKMPKASSRTGSRSDRRASLASRRSVPWSRQGGAHLPRLSLPLVDATISGPGVHLSAATHQTRSGRGWHLRFLSAHCVRVDTETETVALASHTTRSILRRVFRPPNSAWTIPILRGSPGVVSSNGLWQIGAVFAAGRCHTSFTSADPSRGLEANCWGRDDCWRNSYPGTRCKNFEKV
jgi:hypothetical protein